MLYNNINSIILYNILLLVENIIILILEIDNFYND